MPSSRSRNGATGTRVPVASSSSTAKLVLAACGSVGGCVSVCSHYFTTAVVTPKPAMYSGIGLVELGGDLVLACRRAARSTRPPRCGPRGRSGRLRRPSPSAVAGVQASPASPDAHDGQEFTVPLGVEVHDVGLAVGERCGGVDDTLLPCVASGSRWGACR